MRLRKTDFSYLEFPVKDITDQEVKAHLQGANPWWLDGRIHARYRELNPRAYLEPVLALITASSIKRAVVLLGPRRVGKTVLIQHVIAYLLSSGTPQRNIGYAAIDHPVLHGLRLERIIELLFSEQLTDDSVERFVFLDEIQYLKNWEVHLKALVDSRPNLRLLVSGSAAAALKRKSTESGAGRFTDFMLPPLTFSEYLDLRKETKAIVQVGEAHFAVTDIVRLNQQFVDYTNFGGYPELALQDDVRADPMRFVKADIVEKVLLKDLPSLYGVSDIQELNALFTFLAYNTGEIVSLEAIAQRRGISKPTIETYIQYLEAAFLVRRVHRIDQDGHRYKRAHGFKVYLANSAMRCGLFGPLGADDDGVGHLIETAVFAQRLLSGAPLNYARWSSGEIDMIELDAAQRPAQLCEIKWSDAALSDARTWTPIAKYAHKHRLPSATVTTRTRFGAAKYSDVNVRMIPTAALAYVFGVASVRAKLDSHRAEFSSSEATQT